MNTNKIKNFTHTCRLEIRDEDLNTIWNKWSDISNWNKWDASIEETKTNSDELLLGKRFFIKLHGNDDFMQVCITSLMQGLHFSSTSNSNMGLIIIGHSIKPSNVDEPAILEHTIYAEPKNAVMFENFIWENMKKSLQLSVHNLMK